MTKIHPTAVVDPRAELASDVEIGPFCYIGPYVEIGEGTRLHNHVSVSGPTTIGRDNDIYPFTAIGTDPQDLKFSGEHALCIIGHRNQIREHVTIHRGTENGGGITRVGNDNLFMVASHVAHDCMVGSHVIIANQVMLAGHVVIEDGANIGGGAGIHHFATIGTLSFVGGLTRVKKDVPPFMQVDGDPAEVRGVNKIALKRRKFTDDQIAELQDAYKRLFRANGNGSSRRNGHAPINGGANGNGNGTGNGHAPTLAMSQRIDDLMNEYRHAPLVMTLCNALRKSAEGVHGRARESMREDKKFAAPAK